MCSYSSLWIGYYGVIPNKLFWPKNQILQRPLEITNCSFFPIWFCIVLFLRQSLLLWSWLSWNWICKPRWPWTHRGVPVSTFWVLGLKVWAHHIPFPFFKMQLSKIKFRNLIKTYVITQKERDRQTRASRWGVFLLPPWLCCVHLHMLTFIYTVLLWGTLPVREMSQSSHFLGGRKTSVIQNWVA